MLLGFECVIVRIISPIYWSPGLYRLTMWLLYGRVFQERYRVVADLIPTGTKVVELCCGCGYLFEAFLRDRSIDYTGIDLLPSMLRRLRRLGAKVLSGDILELEVPEGDVCVMLGSLYHFHPREMEVLRLMARSSLAILLEPVENISDQGHPLFRLAGRYLSYIQRTSSSYRLTSKTLDDLFAASGLDVLSDRRVVMGKYRLIEFHRATHSEG